MRENEKNTLLSTLHSASMEEISSSATDLNKISQELQKKIKAFNI